MKFRKRRIKIVVASLAVILAVMFAANIYVNENVYVSYYKYISDKVPPEFDGFKIAVISDVHNSQYYDRIIARLDEQRPDLIIFAGDMMQLPDSDLDNVIRIAKSQKYKSDMYAVFGNHEAQNGAVIRKQLVSELEEGGISVLADSSVEIEIDSAKIRLIGIEDKGRETIEDDELSRIKDTVEKNAAAGEINILISHRASLYPRIKDLPVDLIISGHLHGGVARLPFVGGLFGDGEKKLFPDYTSGEYKEGDNATEMIVSRGCDYNSDKMRIFNPPDMPIITLRSAK